MKKISLILLAIVFLFSTVCLADEVTLQWDANTETQLAGYCMYRAERIGDHTAAWEKVATIAKDVTTYIDTVDGENYAWMVTAFDTAGNESFPSNMVELYDKTPPIPVQNLRK